MGDWTNSVVVGIKHAKGEMASFGGRVGCCGFLEWWPMTNANLKTSGTEFRDITEGCKRHGKEREVRQKKLDGENPIDELMLLEVSRSSKRQPRPR